MKKIFSIIAVMLLLASIIPLVSATDTTAPYINMYLGQDQNLLSHNLVSNSLTIWAKFWNRDDEGDVLSCQVDWGEGNGWESVDKGTEDNRYMVSYTYSTPGEKIVKYRCTSAGGTNAGNQQHVDWDSINVIVSDITEPFINMYLGQEQDLLSHNDFSYSNTIWAKFWNRDDESNVLSCEVDWGEGTGWESVSKGTENSRYMVSHTYATMGEKTVRYRCTSIGGTNSDYIRHIDWDSIKIVEWHPGEDTPTDVIYPQRTVRISQFELDSASTKNELFAVVSIDNLLGRQLDNVKVSIIIPELGIKTASRSFDLTGSETVTRQLLLELPEDIADGEYTAMLIVSNDEFKRVIYRDFTVGGECNCITAN